MPASGHSPEGAVIRVSQPKMPRGGNYARKRAWRLRRTMSWGLSTVGCSVSDSALWLTCVTAAGGQSPWGCCGLCAGCWECAFFLGWWVHELVRRRGWAGGGGVRVVRAYRFALDPSAAQERALRSHAGAVRFAWNWGLAKCQERYEAEGRWYSGTGLHKL